MATILTFIINRETYQILIKEKDIYYKDRKVATRLIPPDSRIILKVNRNIVPKHIAEQFQLTEEEKKEYTACQNEEELCKVCIADCLKNGSQLLKSEKIDETKS